MPKKTKAKQQQKKQSPSSSQQKKKEKPRETEPSVRVPKRVVQPNQNDVSVDALEEFIFWIATYMLCIFATSRGVGLARDDYHRNMSVEDVDELHDDHIHSLRVMCYDLQRNQQLQLDVPKGLYSILIHVVHIKIRKDYHLFQIKPNIPQTWNVGTTPRMLALFGRDGYYQKTLGWKAWRNLEYLTEDGVEAPGFVYAGQPDKKTPFVSTKKVKYIPVYENTYVELDNGHVLGNQFSGGTMTNQIKFGLARMTPPVKLSEIRGLDPSCILGEIKTPEFAPETIPQKAMRVVDCLFFSPKKYAIVGVGGVVQLSYSQELPADSLFTQVTALTQMPDAYYPATLSVPLKRQAQALAIHGSTTAASPHHTLVSVAAANPNVQRGDIKGFVKGVSLLSVKNICSRHMPSNVADSMVLNRPTFFPKSIGVDTYFIQAAPLLNFQSTPVPDTELGHMDRITSELSHHISGTNMMSNNNRMADDLEGLFDLELLCAQYIDGTLRNQNYLMSGPMYSKDVGSVPFSPRIICVRYGPSDSSRTGGLRDAADEDAIDARVIKSVSPQTVENLIKRIPLSTVDGKVLTVTNPALERYSILSDTVVDGKIDPVRAKAAFDQVLSGSPARDKQRGILYSSLPLDDETADHLCMVAKIYRPPVMVRALNDPDDRRSVNRNQNPAVVFGYEAIGETSDDRETSANAVLLGEGDNMYKRVAKRTAELRIFGALLSGLTNVALPILGQAAKAALPVVTSGLANVVNQLVQ